MSPDIRDQILAALLDVAPEVEPAEVAGDQPLQEQLDLDSMDFLSFLEGVAERTGVDVEESDYGAVATLDGCVAYVRDRLPAQA
jgi:acyl carrier protein